MRGIAAFSRRPCGAAVLQGLTRAGLHTVTLGPPAGVRLRVWFLAVTSVKSGRQKETGSTSERGGHTSPDKVRSPRTEVWQHRSA